MDAVALIGHGASAAALRGGGKRLGFRKVDERSDKMGSAKLRKTDAGEGMAAFLRLYGATLLGLLLLALVVHDIFGTHGYLAMRRTQQEIKKANADIERLNKENVQLEDEVKDLKSDPRKIEKIARDELGLAKPGEVIIKIPQSQQLPADPASHP